MNFGVMPWFSLRIAYLGFQMNPTKRMRMTSFRIWTAPILEVHQNVLEMASFPMQCSIPSCHPLVPPIISTALATDAASIPRDDA
jgi:hypothetical protein